MIKKGNDSQIEKLKKENKALKKQLEELEKEKTYLFNYYEGELMKVNFVRFAKANYSYMRTHGFFRWLFQAIKKIGLLFVLFFRKLFRKIRRVFNKIFHNQDHKKELLKILSKNKKKRVFVFYPGYEWYMKMYQRPQHMAVHFAEEDVLFFYCTTNYNDNVHGFKKIQKNLYVTDLYELLKENLDHYTLYLYANENGCFLDEMKEIQKKGNNILYEYIDDLHEDLTVIPKELIERHQYVLKNKKIPIVATAQHLYNKAKKIRGSSENIILSTNGVVYEDFHVENTPVPNKIEKLVKQGKPIIGYYGALAKWFDYELIEKMAKEHSDWNILLIGIDYDKSMAEYNYFKSYKNVHYIGTVDYKELVNYGNCCNVLTIPFVINEITLSTSPVKVFEYMTMEKPIVTTDLPECRKYKSVLISKDHKEFIKNTERALDMQDDIEYKSILRKEALENTWDKKVKEILEHIDK